jgi:hypothetical protein
MLRHDGQLLRNGLLLVLCCLVAACSHQSVVEIDESIRNYEGSIPVNFSGSWERDYARGDDISVALNRAFNRLGGSTRSSVYSNDPRTNGPIISQRRADAIVALARLAEVITRQDVFTIEQNAHDISIERKDDYSMFCEFYNGTAKGSVTAYGSEVCGWEGDQFISHLVLPGGLLVSHLFTMGPDGQRMRVITTVASDAAGVPLILNRFYRKFEPSASRFNCVETLSMNRVCSTSKEEIVP